jgi:hypothetical protein
LADTTSTDPDDSCTVPLAGPVTYRGSEADARDFLDAVQARVASIAVKVRWLGGSAVWFDAAGSEVARVTADRPVLQRLIATWAREAARGGRVGMEIADRD